MYRLIRFGEIDLEHYNQVDFIGSGVTPTAYHPLPEGGSLDMFGQQQKHPGTVDRLKSIRLKGADEEELEQLYFMLLSMRGRRERLYRRTLTGDVHWQYARLVEVGAHRAYEQAKFRVIQDVDVRFTAQEAFWHGDFGGAWYLNSGERLDAGLALDSGQLYPLESSPAVIYISIGSDIGRGASRAVRIRILAGDAAITSITIERSGGESITFEGEIAAGTSAVIDTGTMQVTNSGEDAYDDLILSPQADMAAWFTLLPGENEITVTFDGGGSGSEIDFNYYEEWY